MLQNPYSPNVSISDGDTDTFVFTWRILAKADLLVTAAHPVTGVVTVYALDTDYTIDDSGVNNDAGGAVVFEPGSVPPLGYMVRRERLTPREQLTNIVEGGPFPAAAVMGGLDKLTMITQEIDAKPGIVGPQGPAGPAGGQSLFTFHDITAVSFISINGGGTFTPGVFGNVNGFVLSTSNESFNIRGRVVATPTPPYKFTIGLIPTLNGDGSGMNENPFAGILLRNSATAAGVGLVLSLVNAGSGASVLHSHNYTNDTTFSALNVSRALATVPYGGGLFWLQVEDDGTNRIGRFSVDGATFLQLFSVARTTHTTPDQTGIMVNANTSGNPAYCAFVSWLLES